MPIYEFACRKCRVILNFLSKRVSPERKPVCPKCGNKRLDKELSRFAMIKGGGDAGEEGAAEADLPDLDDPRVMSAMGKLESDLDRLDESNPQHIAQMMKQVREIMPGGAVPKELDVAIKRLESGEDPDRIEEDMGDVFDSFMGEEGILKKLSGTAGGYRRDETLYDY
ncbi:MAG: FmdB family zinc ribbon protein [Verrucomicrobiia bacterium]|jgi:putative FmdB family regulatory protein